LNLYTYVENNPLSYNDPSGKNKKIIQQMVDSGARTGVGGMPGPNLINGLIRSLKQVAKIFDGPDGGTKGKAATSKGKNVKLDYKEVFFEQHPELKGKVVVHHAVEQQVLRKPEYKGLFTEAEMHDYKNLRGIPKEINNDLHLSKIRKDWNKFYKETPNATKEQILNQANVIDSKYGKMFTPPIK
jgi:hypothetical protein